MAVQETGVQLIQSAATKSQASRRIKEAEEDGKIDSNEDSVGDIFSSLLLMALLGTNETGGGHREDLSPEKDNSEILVNGDDLQPVMFDEDIRHQPVLLSRSKENSDKSDIINVDNTVSATSDRLLGVSESFREIEHSKKPPGSFDTNDINIPLEGGDMIAFSQSDSIVTETTNNTQPFHTYIDRTSIVEQISREMTHTFQIGSSSARIRLEPPELGEIYIEISIKDDKVNTLMSVEKQEVKDIIEAGLTHLEDELRNQGLKVDQFIVETNQKGHGERFVPEHPGEGYGAKKKSYKRGENYILEQINNSRPVSVNSGLVSIFA